jgi:hypothetical protein
VLASRTVRVEQVDFAAFRDPDGNTVILHRR